MKKRWFKNLQTGDVYYREGFTKFGAMVLRDRDRKLTLVEAPWFNYSPIEATGFPPVKPKFKPRYAIYDGWSCDEAFVKEYEPGKFKVVLKDGSEKEPTEAWRFFAKFFEDGSWYVVPEEEALARLDKPKAPVPSTGQFGPGPWYGAGLKYVYCTEGFYVYKQKPNTFDEMVGWVSYRVVQHLWDLNMVSKERPRVVEPAKQAFNPSKELKDIIDSSPKLQADLAKMATIRPKDAKMLMPMKILVEWMVPQEGMLYGKSWVSRFFPEGISPAIRYAFGRPFKTGRTVEVPQ